MTDPTEHALALASEALHAIRADLVPCEGESGRCRATLERAEGGDWIAVTEAVPAVARVIQGVMDECDALQREVAHRKAMQPTDRDDRPITQAAANRLMIIALDELPVIKAERDLLLLNPDNRLDGYRELGAKCAALEEQRDALKREVEHERQRLAAVGVLAHSRNEAQLAGMLPEYESDSLMAVRELVREVERQVFTLRDYAATCDGLKIELDKLRARDQRMRALADIVDAGCVSEVPVRNLLDAIEETP